MINEEMMLKYPENWRGMNPTYKNLPQFRPTFYILLQLLSLSAACVGSDGQEKQIQKACTEPGREW